MMLISELGRMPVINEDTLIISDTHFGHNKILDFEPCRLTQLKVDGFNDNEHDEWLINKWNSVVGKDDTVLHLGDLAFKGITNYLPRLNGNIILVLGNHDRKPQVDAYSSITVLDGCYINLNEVLTKVVTSSDKLYNLFSGLVIEVNDKRILFSHYPVFNSDKINEYDHKNPNISPRISLLENIFSSNNCDLNIHGHIHSGNNAFKNSKNVSLENINFKPIRLGDLLS